MIPSNKKPKIKFYIKIRSCTNTCNGNGYKNWQLDWAFYRKRGYKTLWTQKLGDGDCGDRCAR